MKKLSLHIILILSLIIIGCDQPAPTELYLQNTSSDDQVDIEVLSPEPDLFVYSDGYDSTGVITARPTNTNIVSISGIKNSYKDYVNRMTYGFALFLDRDQIVETPTGRLLGYRSRTIGKVSFNEVPAIVLPRIVKYRQNGIVKDTLLGTAHILYKTNHHAQSSVFPFPYASWINFKLEPFIGNEINFLMPTPPEITGEVKLQGSKSENNLRINLNWNPEEIGRVEIVIGGMNAGDRKAYPLYRLRLRDNGSFSLPLSLVRSLPLDRFNQLVISFIRKIEIQGPSDKDNYVITQSIHNIGFDVH